MILEIAHINVKAGCEESFENNAAAAVNILRSAKGVGNINLRRSIEYPNHYKLLVEWESVECHMEDFQRSEEFKEWRRLLSPFFESTPEVEHTRETLTVSKIAN
ncbi:antibiotic biosynthesis monooxygenase family protein [Brucella intermedia]|uniref:antibiotic biosynthesis monooxygenase family protein n=1 Tax=Brucella intermedia TaxID=94625 RepID=UPI00224B857C|nr:antibiotic biosynthesis monooxygenase family protein [Brucella intermedia]